MAGRVLDLFSVTLGSRFNPELLRELLAEGTVLSPGERTDKAAELTRAQSQAILDQLVRLVADLPRNSPPEVVWTLGANELLCHTDRTRIDLQRGIVLITVFVACDEVDDVVPVPVPFGIGTSDRPAGLLMSTFGRVQGPPAITDVWTDAITAFAWECVLELCRTIAGNVGNDSKGRVLIPGLVAAARNRLIVTPMARQQVSA